MGLFLRDWRVIGLSGLFRCVHIPAVTSVKHGVLEIMGLDSESRLILGDSSNQRLIAVERDQPIFATCNSASNLF